MKDRRIKRRRSGENRRGYWKVDDNKPITMHDFSALVGWKRPKTRNNRRRDNHAYGQPPLSETGNPLLRPERRRSKRRHTEEPRKLRGRRRGD